MYMYIHKDIIIYKYTHTSTHTAHTGSVISWHLPTPETQDRLFLHSGEIRKTYGCQPKNRGFYPHNGWFISWKTLLKFMIWGVFLYFWRATHIFKSSFTVPFYPPFLSSSWRWLKFSTDFCRTPSSKSTRFLWVETRWWAVFVGHAP